MSKRRIFAGHKIVLPVVLFLILSITVTAVVLFSSFVWGGASANTGTLTSDIPIEMHMTSTDASLTFTEGGDRREYTLELNNTTESHLSYSYEIGYADSPLASAVLVYYDGELLGTLASICSVGDGAKTSALLGSGYAASGTTDSSHTLVFELHAAAPDSYYDGQSITVTLTALTANIDYSSYIFVTSEEEFSRAVDDVNSGMLTDPVIVLGNDITLTKSYELTSPVDIELNGKALNPGGNTLTLSFGGKCVISCNAYYTASPTLTGSIVLNNTALSLNVHDAMAKDGSNATLPLAELVTLTAYDESAAAALVESKLKSSLETVYSDSEIAPLGSLLFYFNDMAVTVSDGLTFSAPYISVPTAKVSFVTPITIGSVTTEFRVIGEDDEAFESIIENELAHIPQDGTTKITSDLFLPQAIEAKNATISWSSADESVISHGGIISDVVNDNQPVSLFATIRINEEVYVKEFSFRVSSQNNETKFSYLVAQLSPITLTNVYDPAKDNSKSAFHHLPIVDSERLGYDYRQSFTTPTDSPNFTWAAYKDIGIIKLEYHVTNTYNYISIGETVKDDATRTVPSTYAYLNTPVFYTYAQIQITGYYSAEEYYTDTVNVIISLGDNTDLENMVFRYVENILNNEDILANILATRKTYGMANEKGDFTLPIGYMTYEITYSKPENDENANAISAITPTYSGDGDDKVLSGHIISVDPAYFNSIDSQVGIKVSISRKDSDIAHSTSRVLYFNTPAVIKPDAAGFENLSVFSSVKYQIYKQLPADERGPDNASGFAVNGGMLVNNTGAYILVRDAKHESITSLVFDIAAPVSNDTVNSKVYTFNRLLEWATADTAYAASAVWAGGGSTTSDGKDYVTDAELAVIKSYWTATVPDVSWDSVVNTAFESAPGRVIVDGNAIVQAVKNCSFTINADTSYFKYTEVLYWALDKQNYGKASGNPPNDGTAPCLGNVTVEYTFDGNGGVSNASSKGYTGTKYYKTYEEDSSPYISVQEAEVIKAFILNHTKSGNTYISNSGKAFVEAFDAATIIPRFISNGGVGYLVNTMYKALGAGGSRLDGATVTTSNFTSTLKGDGLPVVTVLDNSLIGLQHFVNLTSLKVNGETSEHGASAFLTSSALLNFFNQTTTHNTKLTTLEMVACARNYVKFDIEFASRLTNLTSINYAANSGITNVGPLVNLPMDKLSYVNITGTGVTFEFSEYVMENIYAKNNSAVILYTPDAGGDAVQYKGTGTPAESLTFLNEIGQIKAEYLQLCQQIATGANTVDQIIWRIESGNMIQYVTTAGGVPEINTADGMNQLLANYYYCSENVGGLVAGHVYRIYQNGDNIAYSDVGIAVEMTEDIPTEYDPDGDYIDGATGDPSRTETEIISDETTTSDTYWVNQQTSEINSVQYGMSSNSLTTVQDAYGFGYRKYTRTEVKRYTTYTYTNALHESKVKYYYFTGEDTTVEINGRTFYVDKNTVIKWEYEYLSSTSETVSTYTVTHKEEDVKLLYVQRTANGNRYTYTWVEIDSDWNYCRYRTNWWGNYTSYQKSNLITTYTDQKENGDTTTNNNPPTLQEIRLSTQYSYVGSLDSENKQAIESSALAVSDNSTIYYRYTGQNNGTHPYYADGSDLGLTYTNGSYYSLSFGANGYQLTVVADPIGFGTAGSLDSILEAANATLGTPNMLLYYGMYYGYAGVTFTTSLGNTYEQYGIYRLLINNEGKFYFEHDVVDKLKLKVNKFNVINSIDGNGLLSIAQNATSANEGAIYYYDGSSEFFHQGNRFYKLVFSDTGEYMFHTFGAIDVGDASDNFLNLSNERLYYGTAYGGTGGTYEVIISATVYVDGEEYVRKFLVTVVG